MDFKQVRELNRYQMIKSDTTCESPVTQGSEVRGGG